jgi:hypothetical protein
MSETKNIHIIDPSESLIERLSVIKFNPKYVLCEGVDEKIVMSLYPDACFSSEKKVDLILSLVKFLPELDINEIFARWKKKIKSEGLVLFALVNVELDIRELGNALVSSGFVNVVVDEEGGVIYGHLMGTKEIGITVNQIRRMS